MEMSLSPPVLQRRELGSEQFPNLPKVTRQGHKANHSFSDGEIKAQREVNCSKSHSMLAAELSWILAGSAFYLNTPGQTQLQSFQRNQTGKKPKSLAHQFPSFGSAHVVD